MTEKRSTSPREPEKKTMLGRNGRRIALIGLLLAVAVFGVFRYANADDSRAQAAGTDVPVAGSSSLLADTGSTAPAASGGGGCNMPCCDPEASAPREAAATPAGGFQVVDVAVGPSGYDPNIITLKAGTPSQITFSQSQGCTAVVQSSELGFSVDLQSGPQTVELPALEPGTYSFACGMNMVGGQIVVE